MNHASPWTARVSVVLMLAAVTVMLVLTGWLSTVSVDLDPALTSSVGRSIAQASHDAYSIEWVSSASTPMR